MIALLGKIWKKLHLSKSRQLSLMRFCQDQFLVGISGIISNDKKEILLFRHTYRSEEWSLPGGYLKAGEHPREGLEREVEEETGLVVSADESFKIRNDKDTARLEIVYTGSFIGGNFRPSGEVTEARFFSFDSLPLIRKDQLILIHKVMKENKPAKNASQVT